MAERRTAKARVLAKYPFAIFAITKIGNYIIYTDSERKTKIDFGFTEDGAWADAVRRIEIGKA